MNKVQRNFTSAFQLLIINSALDNARIKLKIITRYRRFENSCPDAIRNIEPCKRDLSEFFILSFSSSFLLYNRFARDLSPEPRESWRVFPTFDPLLHVAQPRASLICITATSSTKSFGNIPRLLNPLIHDRRSRIRPMVFFVLMIFPIPLGVPDLLRCTRTRPICNRI